MRKWMRKWMPQLFQGPSALHQPRKKVVDDDVEEDKPAKRQKKEPAPEKPVLKEKPAPKKKVTNGKEGHEASRTRTAYVAPPLSTIVKGQYSAADLHNKFNLTDLQKYAKQEGLKSSGQKKKIIKRIVTYLETGKKDESAPKKGKPKAKGTKQKKSGGNKKKASKEDKEKAAPATESKAGEETQA